MATHNQVRAVGFLKKDPKILNEGVEGAEKVLFMIRTLHRDLDGFHGMKFRTSWSITTARTSCQFCDHADWRLADRGGKSLRWKPDLCIHTCDTSADHERSHAGVDDDIHHRIPGTGRCQPDLTAQCPNSFYLYRT